MSEIASAHSPLRVSVAEAILEEFGKSAEVSIEACLNQRLAMGLVQA
jgi:hypothetical protein